MTEERFIEDAAMSSFTSWGRSSLDKRSLRESGEKEGRSDDGEGCRCEEKETIVGKGRKLHQWRSVELSWTEGEH